MSSFSALKTAIQAAIKQNGNNEITGDILQDILLSIVSTLGDSAINTLEQGLQIESQTRGNDDAALSQAIEDEATARENQDTQLGNLITGIKNNIDNGYVYAGIAIPSITPVSGKVFYIATQAGTYTNLGNTAVKPGISILKYNGSAWSNEQVIYTDGGVFDVSAYNGGATYASLEALLSDANLSTIIPSAVRKGGMSIKFVHTSDNKYVFFKYMGTSIANADFTNTANWQGGGFVFNSLQNSSFSNKIDFSLLQKYNFVIGSTNNIIRNIIYESAIVEVNTHGVCGNILVKPNTSGSYIISFLKNVDFLNDQTIVTPTFSEVYTSRQAITTQENFIIPNDCKYIVFTTKVQGTDITPFAQFSSGINKVEDSTNTLQYICKNEDFTGLESIGSGGTRLLEYKFKQGHLYSFYNNCSANISLVTYETDTQRIEILFGDTPTGIRVYKYAESNANYFKLICGTTITNIDFEIVDESAEVSKITNELQSVSKKRIDTLSYLTINGLINNSDIWYLSQSIVTHLYAVKPGATYKLLTNGTYENVKRIAFLTDNSNIQEGATPHFAGNVPHVIVRMQEEVEIVAPDDAMWLAVLWSSINETFSPLIFEVVSGSFARKNEIENSKNITDVEFINAGLNGEEIEFVTRGQSTTNKVINVSKDIYYCPYGGFTYEVGTGYKIAILPYDDDFRAPTAILNNTWYTGSGSLSLPTPYFRIYVKSTTDDTVITPESGYTVNVGGAVIKYGQNKDYYLIAAQDSEEQYKKIADFVAGEDARPALQVAADEAYVHGTILKMAPGTYIINSSLNNNGAEGLAFSQFVSPHQYDNPYQGVTIEGLRKPSGYVGDAAIIKMSDSLYASVTSGFNLIRTDPGIGQDWQTYFITTALNLNNIIIQIPDNQKPIHAIDLSTAEGGSRLESLRIVGIPIIDNGYYPDHANENSIGIVSCPGSTWNTNSYWNDIEIHGFYYGVYFFGMEHAFVHNLTVQWCEYGMKFKSGGQHPIQLIAVQDEHNVNLPDFGDTGRAIEISGYNASWPEAAPGFPNAQTEGWNSRKRAQGDPIGSVEFTNNITYTGAISTPLNYPTFFEHGQGHRMKVRNMYHQLSGTTTYRRSIAPNYMQQIYDTTLNKMVWCIDTENKTWVDADGTDVDV